MVVWVSPTLCSSYLSTTVNPSRHRRAVPLYNSESLYRQGHYICTTMKVSTQRQGHYLGTTQTTPQTLHNIDTRRTTTLTWQHRKAGHPQNGKAWRASSVSRGALFPGRIALGQVKRPGLVVQYTDGTDASRLQGTGGDIKEELGGTAGSRGARGLGFESYGGKEKKESLRNLKHAISKIKTHF